MAETTSPQKAPITPDTPSTRAKRRETTNKVTEKPNQTPELTPELQECCDRATD